MFEDYIRRDERNAHLFTPEVRETEQPQITTEPVAFYPGEKNNLPYDIVVERLRVEEPEHDPPAQTVSADREPELEEVLDGNPVSVRIDGEWRTFPNTAAAEEAMYEESKAEIRRNAQNFHITDDNLGVGGAKAMLLIARPVTQRSFLRSMKVRSRSIRRQRSFSMTRASRNSPLSRVCRPNTPR